jgi:hypothetical protein
LGAILLTVDDGVGVVVGSLLLLAQAERNKSIPNKRDRKERLLPLKLLIVLNLTVIVIGMGDHEGRPSGMNETYH